MGLDYDLVVDLYQREIYRLRKIETVYKTTSLRQGATTAEKLASGEEFTPPRNLGDKSSLETVIRQGN